MIADIQQALKELLYREAGLPREALDIRFAAPTSAWVAGLTRPTLNFFLHDLRENTALRSMEYSQTYAGNGVRRELAPRRIDLRYLVTVFFKSQLDELGRDEWNVLWRVLAALMRQDQWAAEFVPPLARQLEVDILGVVGQGAEGAGTSVFSSLGLPVRPHLHYTVTVPLDLGVSAQSTLVLERTLGLRQGLDQAGPADQLTVSSSWRLQDALGQPLADALVRTDGGVRAFSDPLGVVHLGVRREQVGWLEVLTLDGQRHRLDPDSPGARLVLEPGGP
jgi:Pvc16 N-terminal domain